MQSDRGRFNDRDQGFPSEEDRVNCPFFFRIGACRNGDRCNRLHEMPEKTSTLLVKHMYPATKETLLVSNDEDWDQEVYDTAQEHMEIFFEEVFLELGNYGEIEDLVVVDNVSDHMVGNVYVKFYNEDACVKAYKSLQQRFYGTRLLAVEYSPVTDFREARCRAFHETRCTRGGLCNFMHIKHVPKSIKRRVVRKMYEEHPEYQGKNPNGEDRSRSPKKDKPPSKRMASPERKAMIAQWNKERFASILPPAPGQPLVVPPPPIAIRA